MITLTSKSSVIDRKKIAQGDNDFNGGLCLMKRKLKF